MWTNLCRCVDLSRRKRHHRNVSCRVYTRTNMYVYYSKYTFNIYLRPLWYFVISIINFQWVQQIIALWDRWPIEWFLLKKKIKIVFTRRVDLQAIDYTEHRRKVYLKVNRWPAKKNVKGQLYTRDKNINIAGSVCILLLYTLFDLSEVFYI